MDFLLYLKAIFALAIVVGLILGLAVLIRKFSPTLMSRLQKSPRLRRLELVETLILDPTRRLVLVRIDQEERLMLLGEGAELFEPRQRPIPLGAPSSGGEVQDSLSAQPHSSARARLPEGSPEGFIAPQTPVAKTPGGAQDPNPLGAARASGPASPQGATSAPSQGIEPQATLRSLTSRVAAARAALDDTPPSQKPERDR